MSITDLIHAFVSDASDRVPRKLTPETAKTADGFDGAAAELDKMIPSGPPTTAYPKLNEVIAKLPIHWNTGADAPKTAQEVNEIGIPYRKHFFSDADYGHAILHEIVHWIGFHGKGQHPKLPLADYRLEEAITETTVAMIGGQLGLPDFRDDSLEYVSGWMKAAPRWDDIINAIMSGRDPQEKVLTSSVINGVAERYQTVIKAIGVDNA